MNRKILIGEDSLTIQRVFELAFVRSDYQVTYVDKGEDLRGMALELRPALIICDVTLPDVDGYEVVSELKKEPLLMSVPVVLLAGSMEPFDEDLFKNSGADGVIFKPFDSQELMEKVEEMVGKQREVEEREEVSEKKITDEGWDFSDVFEEVELGVESGESLSSEEPFISELLSDPDLPEVERVGDYDVGVDELGRDDDSIFGEIEKDEKISPQEEEEPALGDDMVAIGDYGEKMDVTEREEKGDEAMSLIEDEKIMDAGLEGFFDSEIQEEAVEPPELETISMKEGDDEDVKPSYEEGAIMDEEDKMMEEIVRDVEDFPISTGYEFESHKTMGRSPSPEPLRKDVRDQYEEKLKETISSDDFKAELRSNVADITEKILWEVLPNIMDGLKGEILSQIKEVSSSIVPDVARQIIQQEIERIREELELED